MAPKKRLGVVHYRLDADRTTVAYLANARFVNSQRFEFEIAIASRSLVPCQLESRRHVARPAMDADRL
jgi:hypothetical protein